MKDYGKNRHGLLLGVLLPLLCILLAFCAGMLLGWFSSLNKGIAEITAYLSFVGIPFSILLILACIGTGLFLKVSRPYVWYGAIAIALFFVGMEITSQIPSIIITSLYDLVNIIIHSDAY